MFSRKLVSIGTSIGLVIPKKLLDRLKVSKGDRLYLVETPDGYVITPYDARVDIQVELGRRFVDKYRDACRMLVD